MAPLATFSVPLPVMLTLLANELAPVTAKVLPSDVAAATPSVPPRVVAPVPTVKLLPLVTLVGPLKLTVPLPLLNVPVPDCVILPLKRPLTAVRFPLASILATTLLAEFCNCNKSAPTPGVTPERMIATGEVALADPWANSVLCEAKPPTKLSRPLLLVVPSPTKVPSSYKLALLTSRAVTNLAR